MNVRSVTLLALLAIGPAAASAQTPSNPFLGSAPPPGPPSPQPVALSLKDAVTRGLQYNLGLLLQESSSTQARGARWRALEDLLPNLSSTLSEQRTVINLAVYGFKTDPSIIGPFNVFDARVALSQPLVDLRAFNDYRAAALNERAEARGIKSARDLVVLVAVNLYLEAVTAASRIDVVRAQQETAQALFQQASDLKASGLVAGVDVLRAQVQIQNQRQRSIVAQNEFEKAKLQLARAIGLPPGQEFTLTDKIPFAPLADLTLEDALARAYETRADYLAAHDRLAAAEATRRAAGADLLPTLHLDADYGTIGQTTSDSHPTYTVGGNRPRAALRSRTRPGQARRGGRAPAASPRGARGREGPDRPRGPVVAARRAGGLAAARGGPDHGDARQPGARAGARSLCRRRGQQHRGHAGAGDGRGRVGKLSGRAVRPQPSEGIARARGRHRGDCRHAVSSEECSNG